MTIAIGTPGSVSGPCAGICAHPECERGRTVALTLCRCCHEPLGYGRLLVREGSSTYSHAECVRRSHERALRRMSGRAA